MLSRAAGERNCSQSTRRRLNRCICSRWLAKRNEREQIQRQFLTRLRYMSTLVFLKGIQRYIINHTKKRNFCKFASPRYCIQRRSIRVQRSAMLRSQFIPRLSEGNNMKRKRFNNLNSHSEQITLFTANLSCCLTFAICRFCSLPRFIIVYVRANMKECTNK